MSEEQIPTKVVEIPNTNAKETIDDSTGTVDVMVHVPSADRNPSELRPSGNRYVIAPSRDSAFISRIEENVSGLLDEQHIKPRIKAKQLERVTDQTLENVLEMKKVLLAEASERNLTQGEIDLELNSHLKTIALLTNEMSNDSSSALKKIAEFEREMQAATDDIEKARIAKKIETYRKNLRGVFLDPSVQARIIVEAISLKQKHAELTGSKRISAHQLFVIMKYLDRNRELFYTDSVADYARILDKMIMEAVRRGDNLQLFNEGVTLEQLVADMTTAIELHETYIRRMKVRIKNKLQKEHRSDSDIPKTRISQFQESSQGIQEMMMDARQNEIIQNPALKNEAWDAVVQHLSDLAFIITKSSQSAEDSRLRTIERMNSEKPDYVPPVGSIVYVDKNNIFSRTKDSRFYKPWEVGAFDKEHGQVLLVNKSAEEGTKESFYASISIQNDVLSNRIKLFELDPAYSSVEGMQRAERDAQKAITFTHDIAKASSVEELITLLHDTPFEDEVYIIDPQTLKGINKQELIVDINRTIESGKGFGRIPEEYGLRAKVIEFAEEARQKREEARKIFESYTHVIEAVHTLEELDHAIDEGYAKGFSVMSPEMHKYIDIERLKMRIKEYVEGKLPNNSRVINMNDPIYAKVEELKKEYALAHVRAKLESFTF